MGLTLRQQGTERARSALKDANNDPFDPSISKIMETLHMYPAPYRAGFQQTIRSQQDLRASINAHKLQKMQKAAEELGMTLEEYKAALESNHAQTMK